MDVAASEFASLHHIINQDAWQIFWFVDCEYSHCRVRFVVVVSLFVADELRLMLLKDYATTILTDSAE